jgi:hypothetical protein
MYLSKIQNAIGDWEHEESIYLVGFEILVLTDTFATIMSNKTQNFFLKK